MAQTKTIKNKPTGNLKPKAEKAKILQAPA
jgi:hypothetical protein